MICIECKKETSENHGTSENPLCLQCFNRLKAEHSENKKQVTAKRKPMWFYPAIIALLVVGVTLFAFYYYIHTPVFAFKSIASSIENHDWKKFSDFVDVESFYNTTVKGALEDSDNLIAKGIGTLMASNMKEAFIDQLKTQIEQPKEGSTSLFHQLFDRDNILMPKMKVSNRGKIIQVSIPRKTEYLEIEVPVLFNFRKGTMHLTLTSMDLSKFEKVNDKIEELVSEHFLLPTRDSLRTLVTLECTRKYKGCANSFYGTCFEDLIMITTKVTNNSDEDIEKVSFEIYPSSIWIGTSKKKYDKALNIKAKQAVLTGTREGWKYNQFNDEDRLFMNTNASDICYNVTSINFKSGKTIEENKYGYISRYSNEKPTLEDIISRREKYGINDGFEIRRVVSGEF